MKKKLITKNNYLIKIPCITDKRGSLCFGQIKTHIPFPIKRIFYTFNVPKGVSRGKHANKKTKQILICLKGKIRIELDDGINRDKFILSEPNIGIFCDKMIWRKITFLEKNTILLVLASDFYRKNEYIKNYKKFTEKIKK